jgi:hypothetical protein
VCFKSKYSANFPAQAVFLRLANNQANQAEAA